MIPARCPSCTGPLELQQRLELSTTLAALEGDELAPPPTTTAWRGAARCGRCGWDSDRPDEHRSPHLFAVDLRAAILEVLARLEPDEALIKRLDDWQRLEVWHLLAPVPGFPGLEHVDGPTAADLVRYHGQPALERAVGAELDSVRLEA